MFSRRSAPRGVMLPYLQFCDEVGIPLFPWQREAFGGAAAREGDHFRRPLAGISVPRGDGKSFALGSVGLWMLVAGPPRQDIISSALDLEGTQVVMEHVRGMIRANEMLERSVTVKADSFHVGTGSRWTVTSREHTASRGRHATVVLYDEAGWARDDELFASLRAGQASVSDPLMLVTSTVGRRHAGPLWTLKQLADGGDPSVYWYWRGENLSPKVTPEFLAMQRRLLLPAQYAREHQNVWAEDATAFASQADVDAAMGSGWREQLRGQDGTRYHAFVDIGAVHDPSVIGVGHLEGDRIVVDRLIAFQGSRQEPVRLKAVEDAIVALAKVFTLDLIRIESWQGLSAAQSLQRLSLPVTLFTPTAKAHAEEWPVLSHVLTERRLQLFPHARLREELLNILYEVTATGIRVTDRGQVHQDHAVVVRGVAASLAAEAEKMRSSGQTQACVRASLGGRGVLAGLGGAYAGGTDATGVSSLAERAFGSTSGVHDLSRRAFGS